MWADFFVSAEGACRRGGLSMEMFSVATAVSAMSAVPSVSVKHTLRPITIFNKP